MKDSMAITKRLNEGSVQLIPMVGGPWAGEVRRFRNPPFGLFVAATRKRYILKNDPLRYAYEV